MWITQGEAIEMYARFCRARYGPDAIMTVKAKANSLAKTGDVEGQKAWDEVAEVILKLRGQGEVRNPI